MAMGDGCNNRGRARIWVKILESWPLPVAAPVVSCVG